MGEQKHIIKRQVLQLKTRSKEEALDAQERVSNLFNTAIAQSLQTVFDKLAAEDEVISIDQLKVDVGRIPFEHIDEQLPEKLAHELEELLIKEIKEAKDRAKYNTQNDRNEPSPFGSPDANGSYNTRIKQVKNSVVERFFHYLTTGNIHWAGSEKERSVIEIAEQLLSKQPETLKKGLASLLIHNNVRKRIIHQFPDVVVEKIVALFHSSSATFTTQLLPDVKKIQQHSSFSKRSSSNFRFKVWDASMQFVLQQSQRHSFQKTSQLTTDTKIKLVAFVLEQLASSGSSQKTSSGKKTANNIQVPEAIQSVQKVLPTLKKQKVAFKTNQFISLTEAAVALLKKAHGTSTANTDKEDAQQHKKTGAKTSKDVKEQESPTEASLEPSELEKEATLKDAPKTPTAASIKEAMEKAKHAASGITQEELRKKIEALREIYLQKEQDHVATIQHKVEELKALYFSIKGTDALHYKHLSDQELITIIEHELKVYYNSDDASDITPLNEINQDSLGQKFSDESENLTSEASTTITGTEQLQQQEETQHELNANKETTSEEHELASSTTSDSKHTIGDEKEETIASDSDKQIPSHKQAVDEKINAKKANKEEYDAQEDEIKQKNETEKTAEHSSTSTSKEVEKGGEDNTLSSKKNRESIPQEAQVKTNKESTTEQKNTESVGEKTIDQKETEADIGNKQPTPDQQEKELNKKTGKEAIDPETTATKKKSPPSDQKEYDYQLPTSDYHVDVDEVYLENAGLVIVSGFLKYFFEGLHLMKASEFVSEEAQHRAVYLLQYLITLEEKDYAEHVLPLNKLLCGMDITEPLTTGIKLSEEEKEECKNLLQTVIDQWTALKGGSIEGLLVTFFHREGALVKDHNGWRLQVERITVDILLDKLPWGISVIKLPWQKEALYVEW